MQVGHAQRHRPLQLRCQAQRSPAGCAAGSVALAVCLETPPRSQRTSPSCLPAPAPPPCLPAPQALKLVTHIGRRGGADLRRLMARQSGVVRDLLHYRCDPDPFKGDTVWKRVQVGR